MCIYQIPGRAESALQEAAGRHAEADDERVAKLGHQGRGAPGPAGRAGDAGGQPDPVGAGHRRQPGRPR